MDSESAAERAIKELSGHDMKGRPMKVNNLTAKTD